MIARARCSDFEQTRTATGSAGGSNDDSLPGPLVSMVIPCFNAEQVVGRAIESALAQTYPHTDVIVIDDGSTDGSVGVIRSFGDKIRWQEGPNRGACAARNRGIELARGEFVQFLDADDVLLPAKLEVHLAHVSRHSREITYSDWSTIGFDGVEQTYTREAAGLDPVAFIVESGPLVVSAPLHRRALLLAVKGFAEDLPCSQEWDLHLRLACLGASFVRVPQVTQRIYRQRGSISDRNYVQRKTTRIGVIRRARDVLCAAGGFTDARARLFAVHLVDNARQCLRLGLIDEAHRCLEEAASLHRTAADDAFSRWEKSLRAVVGIVWMQKITDFSERQKRRAHRLKSRLLGAVSTR